MFKHAQDANKFLTWILRLVGVFVLFMGFRMMLTLLEVLASFVPIFGDIVGFGASMIALLATAIVAPVVMAIAWFFYRPLWAVAILAAGAAVFFGLRQLAAMRAAGRAPGGAQPLPAGYPQQGYQPQGYPQQGYSPQGNPPQGNPPRQGGYSEQGYPPPQQQGYPQQGFPQDQQQYPPQQPQQPPQQGGGGFLPPGFGKTLNGVISLRSAQRPRPQHGPARRRTSARRRRDS